MPVLLFALAGTALVAASASIANQWLERRVMPAMPRTAERPLPAGRVSSAEALLLSALTLLVGLTLCVASESADRVRRAGELGAVCGGLHPAEDPHAPQHGRRRGRGGDSGRDGLDRDGRRPLGLTAWSLAGVLFLWQFPHFMAIAWLYRREYAAAGIRC